MGRTRFRAVACLAALCLLAPVAATTTAVGQPEGGVAVAAARIDGLLDELRGSPSESIDDTAFARRAYLDVVGRIPDLGELRVFLADPAADRRDRLVDALLASPGHRSHMANAWADQLRLKSDLGRDVSGEPLRHWIRQSLEQGDPYDDMVHALLVAEGPAHALGNGATGLLMRDAGMLEDSMANTARAFLGTRIECAQCHDHPYESWTQEQYFGMVAFTGGMEYRLDLVDLPAGEALIELRRELLAEQSDRLAKGALKRAMRPLVAGISGGGTAEVLMPDDAEQHAGEPVRAVTFTGEVVGPDPQSRGRRNHLRRIDVGSRASLADWITGNSHGLFARVIADRTWARLMGRGVIEPLDDVWAGRLRHPELMAELERLMLELDYDMTAFQRVLLRTRAWRAPALAPDDEAAGLTAPALRRLSAEQVWDSLLTLVVPELDATLEPALTAAAQEVYDGFEQAMQDPRGVLTERFEQQLLRQSDREAFQALRREARLAGRAGREDGKAHAKALARALRRAERLGDERGAAELREQLQAAGVSLAARAARRGLLRASELEQPAPPDHLLARFGQSDRERVDGAEREDAVPQALALLNGFVERELLGFERAALWSALEDAPSTDARLAWAWLAVLGRPPDDAERALWSDAWAADPDTALHDMVWCLTNSLEFLFEP